MGVGGELRISPFFGLKKLEIQENKELYHYIKSHNNN